VWIELSGDIGDKGDVGDVGESKVCGRGEGT
jgi:hypothetical protein